MIAYVRLRKLSEKKWPLYFLWKTVQKLIKYLFVDETTVHVMDFPFYHIRPKVQNWLIHLEKNNFGKNSCQKPMDYYNIFLSDIYYWYPKDFKTNFKLWKHVRPQKSYCLFEKNRLTSISDSPHFTLKRNNSGMKNFLIFPFLILHMFEYYWCVIL